MAHWHSASIDPDPAVRVRLLHEMRGRGMRRVMDALRR